MQSSFLRNIILVVEAVIAFFFLQSFQFLFGFANPFYLGLIIIVFAGSFFITTYIFVKRSERKSKALEINVQAELIS